MKLQWSDIATLEEFSFIRLSIYDDIRLIKEAHVSWSNKNFKGYVVSVNFQAESGLTFHHWPYFNVLSDAQDMAELLFQMDSITAAQFTREWHGKEWKSNADPLQEKYTYWKLK